MEALYLLIPLSTLLVFLAIWVFFRASDSGQFDDLEGRHAHPPRRRHSPAAGPARSRLSSSRACSFVQITSQLPAFFFGSLST